jgi:transcription antitermination factor NusG
MPVLPPEPNAFPEDLFAANDPGLTDERAWWVLHTRARQEKSLARHLHQARVPFYLPLIGKRGLLRGRVLTSHIPLFPGYVFLLGGRDERLVALTSNRVVQALEVADQGKLWHDLSQVWRLIRSGAPITPEDHLEPGAFVEIQSGALAGLKGRIIRAASGRRFVVQVDFIQRGASVLLDDYNLVPIDDPEVAQVKG